MTDLLVAFYPWTKTAHVISVIAWMAGLFYLPRLYVYHVEGWERRGVPKDSDMDRLFQRQERLLLRAIMNPAMIATWVFGIALIFTPQAAVSAGEAWVWTKGLAVIGMSWFHHWLARRRKDFLNGTNRVSGRGYRLMNEIPTVLMAVIVASVIVRF